MINAIVGNLCGRSRQPVPSGRVAVHPPLAAEHRQRTGPSSANAAETDRSRRTLATTCRCWFLDHFCGAATLPRNDGGGRTSAPSLERRRPVGDEAFASTSHGTSANLRGPKSFPRRQDIDKAKKAGQEIPRSRGDAMVMCQALHNSLSTVPRLAELRPPQPGAYRNAGPTPGRHGTSAADLEKSEAASELDNGDRTPSSDVVSEVADGRDFESAFETLTSVGNDEDAMFETCSERPYAWRTSVHVVKPSPFSVVRDRFLYESISEPGHIDRSDSTRPEQGRSEPRRADDVSLGGQEPRPTRHIFRPELSFKLIQQRKEGKVRTDFSS